MLLNAEPFKMRSAQLLNQSEVARDARLTQPTVHRYLNLLETTHPFERLPAYTRNRTTTLLKSPKAFINDTGLAVSLSGYYDVDELRKAREFGGFFETFLYHHLRVLTRLMSPRGRLYFWRTRAGTEVDFLVEHGKRVAAVEIKSTTSPSYGDITGLHAFMDEHPKTAAGILVHSGRAVKRLDEKIIAIPWTLLAGA